MHLRLDPLHLKVDRLEWPNEALRNGPAGGGDQQRFVLSVLLHSRFSVGGGSIKSRGAGAGDLSRIGVMRGMRKELH